MTIRVVQQSIYYQATLYDEIVDYKEYEDLVNLLNEASEKDVVEIRISSPGGDAAVGSVLLMAIKESRAQVVCNVIHPSCSMAAIIAVSGDNLIMQPHTYLMFHTYSGGSAGKSDDIVQYVTSTDKAMRGGLFASVTPFLTKKEIERMHHGKDIYIHDDDPNLPERIKRHFKLPSQQ